VLKTSLLANAEAFGIAGTTKLGGNRVSTLRPFVCQSKFIHGTVSRWGIGGSGASPESSTRLPCPVVVERALALKAYRGSHESARQHKCQQSFRHVILLNFAVGVVTVVADSPAGRRTLN
jgi:hypothetical protein